MTKQRDFLTEEIGGLAQKPELEGAIPPSG